MRFAFLQHYIYLVLFYLVILFGITYTVEQNNTEMSTYLNYVASFLVVSVVVYYYLYLNYGLNKIVQSVDYPLNKAEIIVPGTSILEKTLDSGRGYSLYLEFYPILHSTHVYYTITSKNGQYYLGYNPNSGDLIIKIQASNEGSYTFDNIFTIKNLPMQKKNSLLMNVNQEVVSVYLNDKQYSFSIDGIPRLVTSNIYVGQNNGLNGTISKYMYNDFPLTSLESKRLMRGIKLSSRYILGFIPTM